MERAAQAVSPSRADGNAASDTSVLIAMMQAEVWYQLQLCRHFIDRGDEDAATRAWEIAVAISEAGNLLSGCAPMTGENNAH